MSRDDNKIAGFDKDVSWIGDCFMLPKNSHHGGSQYDDTTMQWMYYSTADIKFTNTSIGGNYTINNPPQFTIFADPPTGRLTYDNSKEASGSGMPKGMGLYYSEAIDDNAQRVSLRFGVPEYKGLLTFFTSFYSSHAAILGNQGRLTGGIFYLTGLVLGGLVALPLTIILSIGRAINFFFNRPSTKYYWLKPAMPLYWSRVNLVSNRLAATMGIVPQPVPKPSDGSDPLANFELDDTSMSKNYQGFGHNEARAYMPDLFLESGGIDVFPIVTKAVRMGHHIKEQMLKAGEGSATLKNYTRSVQAHIKGALPYSSLERVTTQELVETYHNTILGQATREVNGQQVDVTKKNVLSDRLQEAGDELGTFGGEDISIAQEQEQAPEGQEALDVAKEYASQDNKIVSVLRWSGDKLERAAGWIQDNGGEFNKYLKAAGTHSHEFVSFKVDNQSTHSESWSNRAEQPSISATVNGISDSVRSAMFNLSNLKTGFGLIDTPMQWMKDTLYGAMDGFQLSAIAQLAGNGHVDIPETYAGSSASFSSTTYSMQLRSAYGDPLSIYLNIYLPFMCLLAGALPISHGNQAYGPPLLCQCFQRGRSTVRLGMIDSLSVERGVGTVGWNPDGLPLGLDISFSIINLDKIMHMPIDTGLTSILPWDALFSGENAWTDYTATLGNLTIDEQLNPFRKFEMNYKNWMMGIDSYFNVAKTASHFGSSSISRLIMYGFNKPPAITTM